MTIILTMGTFSSGNSICLTYCNREAPSIMADSSSSFGIPPMAAVKIITDRAVPLILMSTIEESCRIARMVLP